MIYELRYFNKITCSILATITPSASFGYHSYFSPLFSSLKAYLSFSCKISFSKYLVKTLAIVCLVGLVSLPCQRDFYELNQKLSLYITIIFISQYMVSYFITWVSGHNQFVPVGLLVFSLVQLFPVDQQWHEQHHNDSFRLLSLFYCYLFLILL